MKALNTTTTYRKQRGWLYALVAASVAFCFSFSAFAEEGDKQAKNQKSVEKRNPQEFQVTGDTKFPKESMSGDSLMDSDVVGKNGKEIGDVENLLLNGQGQIVAVIAEVGGFLDFGDTHVAVPWEEASIQGDDIQLPITEKNAKSYSIFKDQYFGKRDIGDISTVEDDLETGSEIWKASDLINDYVVLENNDGYGYVKDLIFDKNGQLQSVVVNASNPNFAYGTYAYPWYGYGYEYGWDPGLDYYVLPFGDEDFAGL